MTSLNEIFATRSMDEWAPIFEREDVWWAPVQHAHEVVHDPQARAAGGFVAVPAAGGGDPIDMVATPWAPRSTAPEFAQHTEEVLLELGHDWDRIIELKDLGAIP